MTTRLSKGVPSRFQERHPEGPRFLRRVEGSPNKGEQLAKL